MTNKFLTREEAPISPETWQMMDNTMIAVARALLVGRKLLRVEGPYGLGLKAIPLADPKMGEGPMTAGFIPLSYIHQTFTLSKRDLATFERDKLPLDLAELVSATIKCAKQEDNIIFTGNTAVPGLLSLPGKKVTLSAWDQLGNAAGDVIKAISMLDERGFPGPYAVALAPNRYNQLLRLYPNAAISELEHMTTIAADGVFKGQGMGGEGVVIASGQQMVSIVLGQDLTIGFVGPVEERLEFSISESLALLVREPKAVCVLNAK